VLACVFLCGRIEWKPVASMKLLLAGATVASLGLGVGACGGSDVDQVKPGRQASSTEVARTAPRRSGSSSVSEQTLARWDHDGDAGTADGDVPNSFYDGDDGEIRYYGHAASLSVTFEVTALIETYYRAVAAGDGASACSLIAAGLAGALVEERSGASGKGGKTCPTLIPRLLAHVLGRSAADFAAVTVIGVRVRGDEGLALLRLRSSEVRDIPVGREGRTWKMEAILDNGLS
jgi:hypothetical protein